MNRNHPVCACVIMASGNATRFGENKLIKPFLGKPLVSYIIEKIVSFSSVPAVIVTRWPFVAELAKKNGLAVLLHDRPLVSDTIRLGTRYFTNSPKFFTSPPDGIMYCVSDQPLLRTSTIARIFNEFYEDPNSIIRLTGKDKEGNRRYANPVIFPTATFSELEALPPDKTGKFVIERNKERVRTVESEDYTELMDIDTVMQFIEMEKLCTDSRRIYVE